MTWNCAVAGHNKAEIKGYIKRADRVPEAVKAAICAAIDGIPEDKPFIIETTGHLDANGGSVKFSVRTQQTIVIT